MRDALAHIPLRENNLVRAQLGQHAAVELVEGLHDHALHAHLLEQHGDGAAGLDVLADGDDGHVEVGRADLLQHALVHCVGAHHVGESAAVGLHALHVAIHGEDLHALGVQGGGHGGAEAPQADDQILLFLHIHTPFSRSSRGPRDSPPGA